MSPTLIRSFTVAAAAAAAADVRASSSILSQTFLLSAAVATPGAEAEPTVRVKSLN